MVSERDISLRIAVFHNLPSGGAKRALHEWTLRLVASHTVDEYTLATADHGFCDLRPLVRSTRTYPIDRLPLFGSPLGRLNQAQRWRELRQVERLAPRIALEIDSGGYDVVFVHPCLFTTIPAVLPYLRSPTVYFLQEPFGRAVQEPSPPEHADRGIRAKADRIDPLIRLYRRRLERLQTDSLAAVDTLLANSRFTRDRMIEAYGSAASLCRLGVDAEAFMPIDGVGNPGRVLSVGELSPRKGFAFLVEAISHIPADRRPALHLACNMVIAAERARIEHLAAACGVTLQIELNVGTAALAREYNAAAVCVYAPIREPFGLVPLEAMACGRPVVGVRDGGVVESVVDGETGRLVEREAAVFGAALDDVLSNRRRLREWGRNARAHVRREWSWTRSVATLEQHLVAAA